jgi:4-hydroxy-tetrahydrodipicolinate reductase|eukprot:CAMPEP_0169192134 /NCGR_PEP_ID=MMETSP1016-20121227/5444_1 /TAXON_ID=342587 /ORGANISM="Karlodinium micrum, Strain CCMP2283" /LENGTH=285 /DNA_ID=CAMNT_0009268437 /DNA_START=43 /DNA_END=900 /DNA_ORIENTATION=+
MASSGITVMMSGLPGAMGHEVSQACIRRGFTLAPKAMTGPGFGGECEVKEGDTTVKVQLVEGSELQKEAVKEMQAKYGKSLIIIDFTHPSAVNPNAEVYNSTKCPFVMGTTGGDRDKLMKVTADSDTYAVIAPNMCKQIVAFQATMESMAKSYPNAFGGYKLEVVESHQSTKADTSGTAKAVVGSLNSLGVQPFTVEDIQKVREPEKQKAFGVPEDSLLGHAFHTYTLTSEDGSVQFQFKHNVCGRRTYAEGVADAVAFLAEKISTGSKKRIYSMIDVLSEGKMQ